MNDDSQSPAKRKVFIKPELRMLDVKGTKTGPAPDPTEFPGILQAS